MAKAKSADISQALREMRLKAKLKQAELARILGLDQSQISMMEHGRRKVPLQALLILADACGYDLRLSSRRGGTITLSTPQRYKHGARSRAAVKEARDAAV